MYMHTLNKISKYLRILLEVDETYKTLQEKFPNLLDDLISAKTNPSCSCNKRIVEGLTNRYEESEEDKNLIEDIFAKPEIVEAIKSYDKVIQEWERKEKDFFGKVHIVGKSSEDWENFGNFARSQGLHIQGMSVIEKADNLEVRFI